MATQGTLQNFKQVAEKIRTIDKEKLFRPNLGTASLKNELSPILESINKKLSRAEEYGEFVHDSHFQPVVQVFQRIFDSLQAQVNMEEGAYVQKKSAFIQSIRNLLEDLKLHWSHFVTAAVEERGFLEDEGIRKEYQSTLSSMKTEADKTLQQVKEEAEKTIEGAKKLADQIEERARLTAAGISVKDAQEQFNIAQDNARKKAKTWAIFSIIAVIGFIVTVIVLIHDKPESDGWKVVYFTAIRITLLTAVGAIATFCLRIFRATLHMLEHNLHRQRLSNSMAAFVESAATPEQRDVILSHLVDAISSFGNSGLIRKDDDSLQPSKLTIDSIVRSLSSPTGSS
ncbi:hypothetical protein KKG05_05975 [bacterium]|nr:hypothetical protein [bacterium]